jgi:hypothetical protein
MPIVVQGVKYEKYIAWLVDKLGTLQYYWEGKNLDVYRYK